jgi:hypothetical protein
MPLRISRSANSVFYGGESLDPNDLEGTFDHRIWVRAVVDLDGRHETVLNVHTKRKGHQEHVLKAGEDLQLTEEVFVEMTGIQPFYHKPHLACPECGRTGSLSEKSFMLPQAKLLVGAPRNYMIVRDDAKRKKK